jgi:hypothetical protein
MMCYENQTQVRTLKDDMSLELEPMMAVLNALARDTPRSVGVAADVQIKAWIAQTKDLSGRQRMLRDLDDKVALQEVDKFSTMLRAVAQLLAAIRNSDLSERHCKNFPPAPSARLIAGRNTAARSAGQHLVQRD